MTRTRVAKGGIAMAASRNAVAVIIKSRSFTASFPGDTAVFGKVLTDRADELVGVSEQARSGRGRSTTASALVTAS